MKETFDVMFKRVQGGVYKAFTPPSGFILGEFIHWNICPVIKGCPMSEFLDEFKMKVGEVRTLWVTIQEKA